ncbi:DUF695 domain-containing protein [Paenibacillus sp. GCM10027629]|uniref:DUF695 domain-containing protein n=1 Tax=Paenibacillus sp. GCM10027629 TaxID=3273414 RepID=UPI0036326C22
MDNWIVFERIIDEVPTVFTTNIKYKTIAPVQDKKILIITCIVLLNPKSNGLPIKEEHELLYKIEEEIDMNENNRVIKVGRFIGLGIKETYYYCNEEDVEEVINRIEYIVKQEGNYHVEINTIKNDNWDFYFESIYPSENEIHSKTIQ